MSKINPDDGLIANLDKLTQSHTPGPWFISNAAIRTEN